MAYKEKGELSKAIESLDKASQGELIINGKYSIPTAKLLYQVLAEIYEELGQIDKSIECYEKDIELRSKLVDEDENNLEIFNLCFTVGNLYV